MAEKPLPWFRAYPEAAHDPKFDFVARQVGMDNLMVFGAWWKILCVAGGSPVRGSLYVTSMKRYSNGDVAELLRFSNEVCNALINSFIEMEMIDLDENGAYHIKNWEKRQFASDNSTKRVQEHRAKGKKGKSNADETLHDRYSNVSVTPPDTDTDAELKDKSASALLPFAENSPAPAPQPPKRKPIEFHDPMWDILHGGTPAEQTQPPPIDTTWLPADIIDMGLAFMEASKLQPPKDANTSGYWIKELRSMRLHDDLTQDDIRRGVRKMRKTGGMIKSPESVRTAAMDTRAANTEPTWAEEY